MAVVDMKLYGRKFVDKKLHRHARRLVETRDAIVWDIDWVNLVCRVKIQGSDEYVNVHFPRNEATRPSWLKPGNAVRVIHRGGVRGLIEIVGHGQSIPTPQAGSPTLPPTSGLADAVISGGAVTATDSESMDVDIDGATYRINEEIYIATSGSFALAIMAEDSSAVDIMTMSDPYAPAVMGQAVGNYIVMTQGDSSSGAAEGPMLMDANFPPATMGSLPTFTLDPAPSAGQFRYDAFAVGEDGIIDYIKGTASSEPTKPDIPGDHVQLGEYILIVGGTTTVDDGDIGNEWTEPVASSLEIVAVDEFDWQTMDSSADCSFETNFQVKVYDQYGWLISGAYDLTLQIISGTGLVYSGDSGYGTIVSQQFSGSSYTFKYQRDQCANEQSPIFQVTMIGGAGLTMTHEIVLLDENDNQIPEGGAVLLPEDQAHVTPAYDIVQTLASASSVDVDWSEGTRAQVVAGTDITFTFSNPTDGEKYILIFEQDGTGSRTLTLPSSVRYGAEITDVVYSTDANSRTYMGFIYDGDAGKYDMVANVSGYA